MKKIVAITLFFIFLGSSTELHQLLRLPFLFHHFLEHKEQNPDKSFSDFLKEHYSETQNESDSNQHNHDNLPFKTNDCATNHISGAFVNHISFSIFRLHTFRFEISHIYNREFYTVAVVSNIWQPPKMS